MELLFDFFEDHVKAAAVVQRRRPLALGTLCFVLGALSWVVAMTVSGRLGPLPFNWVTLAFFLIWELGTGFALVACLHLISDMEGFQGRAASLFVLFGLANLVWALAVPVALVFLAAFPRTSWPLTAAFLVVGFTNLSLKATYQVSSGRAWFTLILPYLATVLVSTLVLFLTMAGLFIQVMKGFG